MTFASLLALYNSMSEKQAGPKTFASRARLIERIRKTAKAQDIDLTLFRQHAVLEVTEQYAQPQADPIETADAATKAKKKRGHGVGELARSLIMNPSSYPHALIASMVNAEIPGAAATAKSVRWYACKMRKEGTQVPERRKSFSAERGGEQSVQWPATETMIEPAGE